MAEVEEVLQVDVLEALPQVCGTMICMIMLRL